MFEMFEKFISKENFIYIWSLINRLFVRTELIGVVNGVASLDENGKIPKSQLPDLTSSYETIVIYSFFDDETGLYKVDEESADLLRNYSGEKTMYLYEPIGKLYIPYVGNNEFAIDIFSASLYFRVDLDTLICDVGVGEWVSLDENGEISEDKIPGIIVHGYYNKSEDLFYKDENYEELIVGNYKKFFVDIKSEALYTYSGGKYYPITTVAGNESGNSNIEYMPDEEYEKILEDLGI